MRTMLRAFLWEFRDAPPALSSGQLHIWRFALDHCRCEPAALSHPEQQRLAAINDATGRQRYCAARTALRRLLGAYLGIPADEVALDIAPGGKPRLADPQAQLHFNLSHSNGTGLLALSSRQAVGVDIENKAPPANLARIAERVFGHEEIAQLAAARQDPAVFLRLWTRMEARQKCLGQGVFGHRIAPDAVGVESFMAGEAAVAAVAWADPDERPSLQCFELPATGCNETLPGSR